MSDSLATFRDAMYRIHPLLTEQEWTYLVDNLSVRSFARKEFFLQAGERQPALGFVLSGLLRGFYVNDKGEEVTMRFVREGDYATHYSAFLEQRPSGYSFQCLEPAELVLLPYEAIQKGYDQYHGLERFGRLIAENVLIGQRRRIEAFQFQTAEERYLTFVRENPGLFNRVSLSHLSSYLGIQRPSLSRIRKHLSEP